MGVVTYADTAMVRNDTPLAGQSVSSVGSAGMFSGFAGRLLGLRWLPGEQSAVVRRGDCRGNPAGDQSILRVGNPRRTEPRTTAGRGWEPDTGSGQPAFRRQSQS